MIEIDGTEGEGGGQVIRSSLALSMITGKSFCVKNVRGGRKKPGLKKQHLTCLLASKQVSNATVSGDHLNSSFFSFEPTSLQPDTYRFDIGTAGGTSLVAQTIVPALLTCATPSQIVVTGGTHNKMAPPFDFLNDAFFQLVNRMGPKVEAKLLRHGFYPKGGGKIEIQITPTEHWQGLRLCERGTIEPSVSAIVSDLPETIGERECNTILRKAGWQKKVAKTTVVDNPQGPGNVVMIRLDSTTDGNRPLTEIFSRVGERGVPAEKVATNAWRDAKKYIDAGVPIGEHLADQLMLPMAIAASYGTPSVYRTSALTEHSTTHISIIHKFLDIPIVVEPLPKDSSQVGVEVQIG